MAKAATLPSNEFDPDLIVSGSVKKAVETAHATKAEAYLADPDELVEIPGFNVRVETPDYLEHVDNIAQSIAVNGFYPNKPLGGYAGKQDGADVIFVTDGHTRRKAVKIAREKYGATIDKIPVILKPHGQSIEDLTVALIQDNEGRPLTVLEKAIVASRLSSFMMTKADIAKRLNMTDRYVDQLLILAGSPKKVRDLVAADKVSATEAVKQLQKDPEKAVDVLTEAVRAAEAGGKKKASGKHTKAANGASAKRKGKDESKAVYRFKAGEEYSPDEIKPISRVEGGDWWEYADESKEKVRATETVTITVIVERAAAPTTVTEEENIVVDPAPAKAAKPKKAKAAKKGKAAAKKPKAAKQTPAEPEPTEDEFAGL